LKRRDILRLGGLGGFGLALSSHYLPVLGNTPQDTEQASGSSFRFVALGDVGTGNIGQLAIASAMNNYYQQHPF
jgi:hypothetical protein